MKKTFKYLIFGAVILAAIILNLGTTNTFSIASKSNHFKLENIAVMQAAASEVTICNCNNTTTCTITGGDGMKGSSYGPVLYY